MSNQQRPFSWFSLSSIRRQPTARPIARPDPVPQPFRPQQPTWPRTTPTLPPPTATAPPVTRAQRPPAPTPPQQFRPAIATSRPPAPQPIRPPIAQTAPPPPPTPTIPRAPSQPSLPLVAQKPSPPRFTATTSSVSNAKTPTAPAKPSAPLESQPGLASSPVISKPSITSSAAAPITTSALNAATVSHYTPNNKTTYNGPNNLQPEPKAVEPASVKTEQKKTVLMQEVTEKSNILPSIYTTTHSYVETKHHKLQSTAQGAKAGVSTTDNLAATPRTYLESRKTGTLRMVNLVGKNSGALMVLSKSHKNSEYGGNLTNPCFNTEHGKDEIETKEEAAAASGRSNRNKEKNHRKTEKSYEISTNTLFTNSNFQGVNNSMVFDSCITHRDPGLIVSFEP